MLNLSNIITVTPPVTATAINITNFQVNVRDGIMDIGYDCGNYDADNKFIPVGESKNLHIDGADFVAMLTANPTLYPTLKGLLYGLIQTKEGITGTIV